MSLLRAAPLALVIFSSPARCAEDIPKKMDALLEPIRAKHHAPALAAAASIGGKIVAIGAAGVRKVGSPETVTENDLWHIGSCTKSMTASLAALLVQEKTIRWEATVGELFPDLHPRMHASWRGVTLEQLLAHRGGAPAQPPPELWTAAWQQRGAPIEQRNAFVAGLLSRPAETSPGITFTYSNQGYSIAGAMLEKAGGKPFEELITQRLFVPLGLKSAGFGPPGTAGKNDQPRGHRTSNGTLQPLEPRPDADNPPAITAAGRVHLSITDFARYAAWHAAAGRNTSALLDPSSFTKLHTPITGGDYALGIGVHEREWADGSALSHTGSNTYWFAVMWIAPAKDAAFVAATNFAGEAAAAACDDAIAALIGKFLAR